MEFAGMQRSCYRFTCRKIFDFLMCLLTAAGLTPSGSSAVPIYAKTIHRTTQLTTLVRMLSGIGPQSGQTKINDELTA